MMQRAKRLAGQENLRPETKFSTGSVRGTPLGLLAHAAPRRQGRGWQLASFAAASVWLGMLVGVSFIATPAKFMASGLTLPVALDVGRQTFMVFNRVEWGFSAVLLILLIAGTRRWLSGLAIAVAVLVVIAESAWLLPLLDARVGLIIAGRMPPPSNLHAIYIVLELVKLAALLVVLVDLGRLAFAGGSKSD